MLYKTDWNSVCTRVKDIADTENSYRVNKDTPFPAVYDFSDNGLSQLGTKLKFPARFVTELCEAGHYDLAEEIVETKRKDFFDTRKDCDSPLLFRAFDDPNGTSKVHGVLSDRYSIFDDNEVIDILSTSEYLMDAGEIWSDITPDRFHVRFISKEKLYIGRDTSPLSMCVFIDNSMVGLSMFRIRFGLYRWACTNGVICGLKDFTLVKERHIGLIDDDKNWEKIVALSLEEAKDYENMMLSLVNDMSLSRSAIYGLTEEEAERYLRDKLHASKKIANAVILNYFTKYGGESRWDLCNAITDTAHEIESIGNRMMLEELAFRVA